MNIPLIKNTFYNEDLTKKKLADFIINSTKLSMGTKCFEFERKIADFHNTKYACLVNSGSSANLLLIQALISSKKLLKGDNIAVSGLTWSTNVMPLIQLGLNPIPIDVATENLNIDLNDLINKIEQYNIKALFLTNLLGFCTKLDILTEICKKNNILLIEDNCESLGSVFKNKLLGTFGIASSCSFFVGHHLSTIEGGVVITDDENLYDHLKIARAHGWVRDVNSTKKNNYLSEYSVADFYEKYTFFELGFNLRPNEITGFLGLDQLQYLEEMIEKRESNFMQFKLVADKNPLITKLKVDHLDRISNFAYPLIFNTKKDFEYYLKQFQQSNIEVRPIVSGSISKQPFFMKYNNQKFTLENAEKIHDLGFYFPNNPEMDDKEIEYICNILR